MNIYRITLAVVLATVAGCAVSSDSELDELEDVDAAESELAVGSELAADEEPECECDLSGQPACPDSHPMRVWKRNTCDWSETRKKCHGKCETQCATSKGVIKSGSVFKGKCGAADVAETASPVEVVSIGNEAAGCEAIAYDVEM